jgi:hypothetical protein
VNIAMNIILIIRNFFDGSSFNMTVRTEVDRKTPIGAENCFPLPFGHKPRGDGITQN